MGYGKTNQSPIQIDNPGLDQINQTINEQGQTLNTQGQTITSQGQSIQTNAANITTNTTNIASNTAQLASRAYKRITEFGAISDANYYNSADGNYYVDSSYTTRSTDNTQAFSTALNSGYNIFLMPGQQFYISTGIILNSSIKISGVGAKVYVKSSTQPTYAFYIKGDFTSIEGLSVNSTLDYAPVINGVGKAGKGSNIIAFQVEANYIEINNCKTNNCDYGVARNTMVNCNNLYVDHCSFENAAIGIFAFYITNMFVSNTYVSCNNSGLDIAFHCVYISDYATNVFFDNVKMLWPTDSNGAIIQLYSARSIYAQNVHFTNCEIETYGVIGVNITYCNGLTVSGCKFIMHQLTNETGSKLFFSQGYLSDVTFKNCIVDMYTANVLADGLSTNVVGDINVENCTFNITQTNGTNIVGVVVPVRFIQCNFIIGNFTNGQFLGSASSTPSHIRFINCYFDALQGRLMFGNGDMSIHGIVLINTIIINRGVAYGYVFYNQNDAKFMMCIGNKFYGYNAITSPTDATLNDNILSAIANTYYSQANLP